jgi:8-oxo-dGTP pyrophosphatase MutT (NUDIX family)
VPDFLGLTERIRSGLKSGPVSFHDGKEQAAVLILLQDCGGETEIVLTERAMHMRLHPGEIAFPGGRCDPEDSDRWDTALREAEEEVALPRDRVEKLGHLESMVTRSDIEITPCVGRLLAPVALVANPDELDQVFCAPLAWFAQADNLKIEEMEFSFGRRSVPHYCYQGHDIWGVTAFMLVRLANIGYGAGFDLER